MREIDPKALCPELPERQPATCSDLWAECDELQAAAAPCWAAHAELVKCVLAHDVKAAASAAEKLP